MKCKFKWDAPFQHPPPSYKVSSVEQECKLEEHHNGPHKSLTNVVHPNDGSSSITRPTWDRRTQL